MSNAKTFGPYDSEKQAMRANCVPSMKGGFCQGRALMVDGKLMISTSCVASRHADNWIATVGLREATEQESAQYATAVAKRDAERAAAVARENANYSAVARG